LTIATYLLILLGSSMAAIGGVLLKTGARFLVFGSGPFSLFTSVAFNGYLILGLALYVFPTILWIHLLRFHELSKLQPLLAVVYVITPILSIVFLGEKVDLLRWVGIAFIVLGVGIISKS
jgi:drug/metabolite transporter (DMT)-like permease